MEHGKGGPFLAEGVPGKIYFVQLNKSKVVSTINSPFEEEYEILSQNRVSPLRIVESVEIDFFKVQGDPDKQLTSLVDQVFNLQVPGNP